MKRKNITNQSEAQTLVEELAGFLDLGMKRESMSLVRKILAKPNLDPIDFTHAMNALGMMASMADLRKFVDFVESAYSRQSPKKRHAMKSDMLRYFCSLENWEKALSFITPQDLKGNHNAVFVMELLLKAERMTEARKLAGCCESQLQKKTDRFTFALMIEALAVYCAATGDWDKALELWTHAPLEEPFRQNAMSGIVKIHLARALKSLNEGIQSLSRLKKSTDDETILSLPGNDDSVTSSAEMELLSYKRRIEKLLPLSSRRALGMSD